MSGIDVTVRHLPTAEVTVRTHTSVGVTVGGSGDAKTIVDEAIAAHRVAPAPHPAYDDIPDLTTLFKNGLA